MSAEVVACHGILNIHHMPQNVQHATGRFAERARER